MTGVRYLRSALLSLAFGTSALFAQWQPDVRLTSSGGVSWTSYNSARCIAGSGQTLHVVWFDQRDGNFEIYYKRSSDGGASWSEDVRMTSETLDQYHPAVAASGSDVHVVWWDERYAPPNTELYYKRSTDAGVTWSEDIRLTDNTAKSHYPSIAVEGRNVHIVWWDERTGWDVYYKRSTDAGVTWSDDVQLTTDMGLQMWPTIAVSGPFVHVAWYDNRAGTEEIFYKRSTDAGATWSEDVRLTENDRFSEYPTLAAEDSVVHVAWSDDRDANWEIYYKSSSDAGATWTADTRLTNAAYSSQAASIAMSGRNVHLVWADNRANYWADIYYKYSSDGGETWAADARLFSDVTPSDRPTVCLLDSSIHVVWEDARDASDWEIYYKRCLLGATGAAERPARAAPETGRRLAISPNPFRTATRIAGDRPVSYAIRDAAGCVIEQGRSNSVGAGLLPGIYFLGPNPSGEPARRIVKIR